VPEPSISEVEAAIGKLKMNMSSGTDQIQEGGEGGRTLHSEIHRLITLI
jgi:hypothetical protein